MFGSLQVEHLPAGSESWEYFELDRDDLPRKGTVGDVKTFVSQRLAVPKPKLLLSLKHERLLDENEKFATPANPRLGCPVLHVTNYVDVLPALGSRVTIPSTEDRGISLSQLRALCLMILRRTFSNATTSDDSQDLDRAVHHVINGWYDTFSDKHEALEYETINLYQLSDWVIKPMTLRDQNVERVRLPHEDTSLKFAPRVPGCSYVEAVSLRVEDQRPSWFVSHAWIEPVVLFVRCLDEHCRVRQLPDTTSFWICAYANNQHTLEDDIVHNPRETSFFRAMMLCTGVILVLDANMTPFSRIWCCFEASVVVLAEELVGRPLLWDIAIADCDGIAQILTDGVTREDLDCRQGKRGNEWNIKSKREESFPIQEVLAKAFAMKIEEAEASVDVDRNRILNSIAGRCSSELDHEPLENHMAFARVDDKLHSMFAIAAWRQSLAEEYEELLDKLVDVLRDDVERKELRLNFQYSEDVDNRVMERLGAALPDGLKHLALQLDECPGLRNEGIAAVAINFGKNLLSLDLSFASCCHFGDSGVAAIAEFLPSRLQRIHLDLTDCMKVRGPGIMALGKGVWKLHELKVLMVNCCGCDFIVNDAFAFLAQHLGSSLELLDLDFMHCKGIRDSGIAALAVAVAHMNNLRSLKLNLNCCSWITESAAAMLVAEYPPSLDKAVVQLRNTSVPRSVQRSFEILESMRLWLEELREDPLKYERVMALEPAHIGNQNRHTSLAPARPATPQVRIAVKVPKKVGFAKPLSVEVERDNLPRLPSKEKMAARTLSPQLHPSGMGLMSPEDQHERTSRRHSSQNSPRRPRTTTDGELLFRRSLKPALTLPPVEQTRAVSPPHRSHDLSPRDLKFGATESLIEQASSSRRAPSREIRHCATLPAQPTQEHSALRPTRRGKGSPRTSLRVAFDQEAVAPSRFNVTSPTTVLESSKCDSSSFPSDVPPERKAAPRRTAPASTFRQATRSLPPSEEPRAQSVSARHAEERRSGRRLMAEKCLNRHPTSPRGF